MSKKKFDNFDQVKSSRDAIQFAGERGAELHHRKNGNVKVKTEKGSAVIYDSDTELSKHDRANYRRWFKFLGLLAVFGFALLGMAEIAYSFGVWSW